MRVEMRHRDAGLLQFADLERGFRLDLIFSQTAKQRERAKPCDSLAKTGVAGTVATSIQQTADCCFVKQGSPVHQDDVTAHTQPRPGLRQSNSVLKSLAIGHQCGRSDHPMFVGFQDGAIHTDSKTEIVGIDDQAAHRASLAGT
jgi:hypothetical protein